MPRQAPSRCLELASARPCSKRMQVEGFSVDEGFFLRSLLIQAFQGDADHGQQREWGIRLAESIRITCIEGETEW